MDGRENGRGRIIGSELRRIPRIFLEPCWGMKWTTKYYPREPSDYDIGVLTPDGIYSSLKNLPVMENGYLDPFSSPRIICDWQPSPAASGRGLPSSPSCYFSLSTSPVPSIVYEIMQDQPDITYSDDTPVHSSVHLTAPRMEGHIPTLPVSITATGRTSFVQSLSEPYTSELSFALLPGPSPRSSQSCGTPTVGTPQHLPNPDHHIMPAVLRDRGVPLYNAATENSAPRAPLAHCVSAEAGGPQHYLRPTIGVHSTPQVHVNAVMQTSQTTFPSSWDDIDFSATSVTPMICSTSFSADCALMGEFEQHHGSGVTTLSLDLKEQTHSNDLSEEGVTDESWQSICGGIRCSPMYQSRGLSPNDMGMYQLPGTSEGDETANNPYDACLFSNYFPVAFGR